MEGIYVKLYFKDLCKIQWGNHHQQADDGGDIGGRDSDGVVLRGAQNVSEPLRSWGLLGAGGLIRSHGSLARSIPHSPNLLYVLNLQQQKSCDGLKLLVQIKQYEKSWIIGVYCPPMGIWDCRAAWKRVEKIGNSGGIYKSNNFPPLSLFGRNPLW